MNSNLIDIENLANNAEEFVDGLTKANETFDEFLKDLESLADSF